jgi:DNA repair protein RecO (recombination protein O)
MVARIEHRKGANEEQRMPAEKARAIVLRTTDWSETSRIATLWTREFGRVHVLAKGGRRLRSAFENALDLLTLCDIVLLRKTNGSLDLLTEARVAQRFPRLRDDLSALYGAYYVAELLADWTSDYDPHPALFDEAVETLRALGLPGGGEVGPRVMRFELTLLRELGYGPALETCAGCGGTVGEVGLAFSAAAGGVVCGRCQPGQRERRPLSPAGREFLRALAAPGDDWRRTWDRAARAEVRQVLGQYVTYLRGTRPRLLPYLGG